MATGQASGLCVIRHRFDELLCRSAGEAGATVVPRGKPVRVERLPTRGSARAGRHAMAEAAVASAQRAGGLTILASTPYMDEAARCERVGAHAG